MDVDVIEQGPADPFLIAQHIRQRTRAFLDRVAVITARTRIHRADEQKIRGKSERIFCAAIWRRGCGGGGMRLPGSLRPTILADASRLQPRWLGRARAIRYSMTKQPPWRDRLGLPDDKCAIRTPCEMIHPNLCPGVEKWHSGSALEINCLGQNTFGFIAQAAREPQVLFAGLPASGFGDDVLHGQRDAANNFLRQAITTAVARSPCNALAQCLGSRQLDCSNSCRVGNG